MFEDVIISITVGSEICQEQEETQNGHKLITYIQNVQSDLDRQLFEILMVFSEKKLVKLSM